MSDLLLKWENLEETKVMNCTNILAVDDCGIYHLGKIVNGDFYELDYRHISRHRKIDIVKYIELPQEQ